MPDLSEKYSVVSVNNDWNHESDWDAVSLLYRKRELSLDLANRAENNVYLGLSHAKTADYEYREMMRKFWEQKAFSAYDAYFHKAHNSGMTIQHIERDSAGRLIKNYIETVS